MYRGCTIAVPTQKNLAIGLPVPREHGKESVTAMFIQLLDVPYHKQTDPIKFCGPACAQMILGAAAHSIDTQSNLYANVCNSDPKWFTNPKGLADTLSDRSAHALDATHDDRGFGDPVSAVHAISWTIAHHLRAPIALINGESHWVVVTGCILSGPPTEDYSVIAFVIQDPLSVASKTNAASKQIEFVTYAYWMANQFQDDVDIAGDFYKDKWVVVGAGDEPKVTVQAPDANAGGAGPVDAEGAVSAAEEGVRRDEVQTVEQLAEVLNPTTARGAVPVAQLGSQEPKWYIVPFSDRSGRIPAAALVDAQTGAFLGVIAMLGGSLSYVDALQLLTEGPAGQFPEGIPHPDTGEPLPLDGAAIASMPEWAPCAESSVPYLPFWRIGFDTGEQQFDLFVRLDGQVFRELTPAYG